MCSTSTAIAELRPLVLLHEGLGSIGLWRSFPADARRAHGPADRRLLPAWPWPLREPGAHGARRRSSTRRPGSCCPHCCAHWRWPSPCSSATATAARSHSSTAARRPVTGVVTLAAHVFVEDICIRSIEEIRDRYVDGDLRERLARHHDDPDAASGAGAASGSTPRSGPGPWTQRRPRSALPRSSSKAVMIPTARSPRSTGSARRSGSRRGGWWCPVGTARTWMLRPRWSRGSGRSATGCPR